MDLKENVGGAARCCTSDPSYSLDIALGVLGMAAMKPVTIPEYYQLTFDKMPDKKALCWKDNKDGPWKSLSYG